MRYCAALFCLLILCSQSAHGHQQKESVSTVLFNERTGNVEVAHRFYIHDAEHAVKKILGKDADLLRDKESRRRFGQYVEENFEIRFDNKDTRLAYVGHDIEGKFFWVYQEVEAPDRLDKLNIVSKALRDIWPLQRNIVNVEGLGPVKSLVFSESDNWQFVEF